MKKKNIGILISILLIFLCFCNNTFKKFSTDFIEFIPCNALVGINTGNNNKIGKSIIILSKIKSGETNIDMLIDNIKNEVNSVQLLSHNNIISDSEKIDWISWLNNDKAYLSLTIYFDDNFIFNNDYIDSIRFNNNKKQTYKIGKYNLCIHEVSKVKELSVVEFPIQPNELPKIGEKFNMSYKIMSVEKINKNNLNFNIKFTDKYKEYISVNNIKWSYDKTLTDKMYKEYIKFKTEEELKNFKIYDVNVTYILNKKTNIIFQPFITAQLNDKKFYAIPEEPLFILYNN